MKKTAQHVMMLFLLASACGAAAGVFDDAKVWVRGAVDQNGDGQLKTTRNPADTSDLPNALKAGVTSDPSNVWEVRGPAANAVIVENDVPSPLAGTVRSVPCVHFYQQVQPEGATYGGLVNTTVMPPVTNKDWRTVFVRFRLESFMDPTKSANLVTLGHSATSGKGAGWKLQLVPDEEGEAFHFKVVNGRPKDNSLETGVGTKELEGVTKNPIYRLARNAWVDVVFACGGKDAGYAVDVYSCAEGGNLCSDNDVSVGWNSTMQEQSGSYNNLLTLGSTSASAYNLTASYIAFRGDIAEFAYWDRRLTEEEAAAAMGYPRNDIVSLGVKNGSADEFAGSAGTTVDADAINNFLSVPRALSSQEALTVRFSLNETNGLGLAQALRIAGTAESPEATFSAVMNGNELVARKVEVAAGGEGVAVLPARVFQPGENLLVLRRTDAGSSPFLLDALALGGSWSIGVKDDSHGEFAYVADAASMRFTRTADANWKHTVICLQNDGNYAENRLYANLDATLAATRRFRLTARLCAKRDKALARIPMSATLTVNDGAPKPIELTTDDYDAYRDFSFVFAPGELQAGENVFKFVNTSGTPQDGDAAGYISIDCRQLEVMHDPTGLMIQVR